jgi:ribosomal protein S18 acetylase RimI-like enzyme
MAPNIREMTETELTQICEQLAAMDPWRTLDVTPEKLLTACTRDKQRLRYVLTTDDSPMGTVMFRKTGGNDYLVERRAGQLLLQHHQLSGISQLPDASYINILAVFPGNQGNSYGTLLLSFAEQQCAPHVRHMYLCVSDFNDGAQRFYAAHGYEEIGRIPDLIKVGYAEILMAKPLS